MAGPGIDRVVLCWPLIRCWSSDKVPKLLKGALKVLALLRKI